MTKLRMLQPFLCSQPGDTWKVPAEEAFVFRDDGYVRDLCLKDKLAIFSHWVALPARDTHLRFGVHATEHYLQTLLTAKSFDNAIWIGHFTADNRLIGVAQTPLLDGGAAAELGLSVESGQQGRGIGAGLLQAVMARLQSCGVATLHVMHLRENKAMMALCSRYSGSASGERNEIERQLMVAVQ